MSNQHLLVTPEEAAEALRIGRSLVYRLMKDGKLEYLHVGGKRRLIPAQELVAFVDRLRDEQGRRKSI